MTPWVDLSKAVPGIRGVGAHVMPASSDALLRKALRDHAFRAYVLEGTRIRDAQGFFAEISRVMDFPDWFGRNWDAVRDCLKDIEEGGPRIAVVVLDADQVLSADAQVLLDALEILRDWAVSCLPATDGEGEDSSLQIEVFLLGRGAGFLGTP